ncbi:DHS-like NAD/FAD-binding domain-containing protein [Amylostereum chailletii]|nr:DHS-like NAD/FAD-binding domain-containing protein [Amylostereum chailletii]
MASQQSSSLNAFKAAIGSSKHIIAIAGAGLSAGSRIPTFRGAGGFWRKHEAMSLATPEAFARNPSRVWQFYHYRREKALQATPNAGHIALARLSIPSFRDNIAPGSTFTLITQNVDGLSRVALDEVYHSIDAQALDEEKRPPLLEMHGRLFDVVCTSYRCGHREYTRASPLCPSLEGTDAATPDEGAEPEIATDELPRCTQCGKLARPGVVWFGEQPVHLEIIDKLVTKADMCLVVGTSSTVWPAAGYAQIVKENGGKVAVFNLDRSTGDEDANFLFLGPSEKTLPEALGFGTE